MKPPKYVRDMAVPMILGYRVDRHTLSPIREPINTRTAGDYGADPLGDGTFRMLPSGDIVGYEERCKRLERRDR